jgi:hypothetical protein
VPGDFSEIEDEIGYSFDYDSDYGEFLLIRLKSGIEVGFLNPLASDGDNADIVSNALGASAQRILDELLAATGLERGIFTERR